MIKKYMKKLIILFLLISNIIFSQQQNIIICEDTSKSFSYSTNSGIPGIYFWSIDGSPEVSGGPTYNISWNTYGQGLHTVSVRFESELGCLSDPIVLNVFVDGCSSTVVWAPNTFTPNGDENNNTWMPIGVNYQYPYYFIINRWGNIIFESYDFNLGWDGTYKGKMCQDGVYFYSINWKDLKGEFYQKHGHITLLR